MISTQKTRASIKKAWAALCSQLCCAKIFCVSEYLSTLPSVPLINIVEAPIRWRNQIETSSRRVKLPTNEFNFVMLNLFQHLTRLADILDAGKTLKQVQGDSISALQSAGFFENEYHTLSLRRGQGEGSSRRVKAFYFRFSRSNTSLKVRCKSLHFGFGVPNTNLKVRCKKC